MNTAIPLFTFKKGAHNFWELKYFQSHVYMEVIMRGVCKDGGRNEHRLGEIHNNIKDYFIRMLTTIKGRDTNS